MTRENLLAELIRQGCLQTPALRRAFERVDKKDFVPDEYKNGAYENYSIPIGLGQNSPSPLTVAFMLELLAPQEGNRILEIGAGSGWQATLLSYAVSGGDLPARAQRFPSVVAIERIPEIKEQAERNTRAYGVVEKGVLKMVLGDGSRGYPAHAPYNRIICAASGYKVPVAWKAQLSVGGRIVAAIEDTIEVHEKLTASDYNIRTYHGFKFVPLVEDNGGDGNSD